MHQDWVCLNGVVMPAGEAAISVFDAGFMQGIGFFSTLRACRGRPMWLERHIERIRRSIEVFGWTRPLDAERAASDVGRLLAHAHLADARVRITVTCGSLHTAPEQTPELTTLVTAQPEQRYPAELYERGCTIQVSACCQGPGDPLAGHKTTSYYARLVSLRAAHTQGAFETLWLTPEGHVAEGAISNIFAVRDGVLCTPPLDTPVLPGIARANVMALAPSLGVHVREERFTLDELFAADEAFLTNCMMDVMPVVRIDRRSIGEEQPGELTSALMRLYAELCDRESEHG
jgi:branched-subunit amino acid aminotransferase/4-amino-4-deoxychorismate lyase